MTFATILTYVGAAIFGLPAAMFIVMTVLMMKDLSREDPTVSALIKAGYVMMLIGAIILFIRFFFFI